MKIVVLSANFPYGIGGDNNFIKNEIGALSLAFDEVTVISTGSGKINDDLPPNVKSIQVRVKFHLFKALKSLFMLFNKRTKLAISNDKQLYRNVSFFKKVSHIYKYNYMYTLLAKNLKNECKTADIIYSYWLSSRAFAALLAKDKYNFRCPIVSRAHRFDLYLYRNYLPFRLFIGNKIDSLIFISNDGLCYFRDEIYPLLKNKPQLKLFYLGINKSRNDKEYIGSDKLRVVSCSNIIEVKRLDIIINALAGIYEFDVEWIHFGGGNQSGEILTLANEMLGNKPNIAFSFMGPRENSFVQNFYKDNEIDIFLNSSDSEGVPVSIMEAISFGIPVICRDVGGNSEINRGNNSGFLLPSSAGAGEFCSALKDFYYLPIDNKIRRRNEMKEIFTQNFSIDSVNRFVNYLREMNK